MKISIENYKNIGKLDLLIESNKINYLFGISGSGKTSIAQALLKENYEENYKIGKNLEDINITILNQDFDANKIRCYNNSSKEKLLFETNLTSDTYKIIIGNNKDLEKTRKDLANSIKELDEFQKEINIYIHELEKLKKEFTIKINKDGNLSERSKLHKLKTDVDKIHDDNEAKNTLNIIDVKELEWKINGKTINNNFSLELCPYCDQQLTESQIELIKLLSELTPKNFAIFKDSKVDFKVLDIPEPKNQLDPKELEQFKNKLIESIEISNELSYISNQIIKMKEPSSNPSQIGIINLTDKTLNAFPKLKPIIEKLNNNLNNIKKIMGKNKTTFNEIVGTNLKKLNNYIKKLGIPYEFRLDQHDLNQKEASFILYHVDDENKFNRVSGLSSGEQNMISLIIFLLIEDGELIIIDDPASSYDHFRRKTILDMIYEFSNNRTILVLSHDNVFLKYALLQRDYSERKKQSKQNLSDIEKKYYELTGNISYLENFNDECNVKTVKIDDFKPIEYHIKNHLANLDEDASFYRKVINLRLLAEIKKYDNDEESKLVYGYLSAILHKEKREAILNKLRLKNVSEEEILDIIEKEFEYKLEKIPENYISIPDYDKFSTFEIAISERENLGNTIEKDELNNIVHYNDTLLINLNPYKFNTYSSYINNIIKKTMLNDGKN